MIQVLTTLAELEHLAPEWDALCDHCPWATPFQRPAWLVPWARHLGPRELLVLAARSAGRLVGLLPGFVWRDGGERAFALLGAGITDYLDVVADADHAGDAVFALVAALAARKDVWDRADFDELRPTSPLLTAPVPPGLLQSVTDASETAVLTLPSDGFDAAVPASTRRNHRNARHRADRHGGVRVALAAQHELEPALEALVRLHAARWHERGETGVLDDPRVVAFHREALPRAYARGLVRMHVLRADGAIVAVIYVLVERAQAFYYLQGIDPAFAHLSPGTLLLGCSLEHALGEGVRVADFLRGGEDYKLRWGAALRANRRRTLRHGR